MEQVSMKGSSTTLNATWAALAIMALTPLPAQAACPIPNSLTNGQVADASQVMDNFNAVAACANAAVVPTGSPPLGSIAVFSGSNSVTNGDLSGDVTTGGSTATTLAPSGVVAGSYTSANIIVDAKGRVTAASNGGGGGSGGGDIVMAVGAAWAKEMVLHGTAINAGTSRSVIANLGGYVGMRLVSNTNSGYANRVVSTVTYTVPSGAIAFVVHGKFSDPERNSTGFYGSRLYNATQSSVSAGATLDSNRATPSGSPGVVTWSLNYSGTLSTDWGDFNSAGVAANYPVAGTAGDVLQLEAWTSGDGAYRIQDIAVYLVVVSASTGDPLPNANN